MVVVWGAVVVVVWGAVVVVVWGAVVVVVWGAVVVVVWGTVVVVPPVVPPLASVQVLWASMTSVVTFVPGRSVMCTALTVSVCPPLEKVCSFNISEPVAPSEMVVLGGGFKGTVGEPAGRSTKVPRDVVPVGVVPVASQDELIAVPLIPVTPKVNAATDAELKPEVGEAFAVRPLAVRPCWLSVARDELGGAVGVGATVTNPVALIPKAVPDADVAAPADPLVAMRKTPNSRKAAEATPATFDL